MPMDLDKSVSLVSELLRDLIGSLGPVGFSSSGYSSGSVDAFIDKLHSFESIGLDVDQLLLSSYLIKLHGVFPLRFLADYISDSVLRSSPSPIDMLLLETVKELSHIVLQGVSSFVLESILVPFQASLLELDRFSYPDLVISLAKQSFSLTTDLPSTPHSSHLWFLIKRYAELR